MTETTDSDALNTDHATEPATGTPAASASREAAKYRTRLRDTEAERDTLREKVAAFERATAERVAAEHMADPADLWNVHTLDDLRDTSGEITAESVAAVVEQVLAERAHWRKRANIAPDPSQGLGNSLGRRPKSWTDVLQARGS